MKKLRGLDEDIVVPDDDDADDDDDDDEAGYNMQFLSDMLEDKPKKKKKAKEAPVLREAYSEGQYNISTGDSKVGAVTVERLLGALGDANTAAISRAKKKLTKFASESAQTVGIQKPKHEQEKDERQAVAMENDKKLKQWTPVVDELREMDSVMYPLHDPPSVATGASVSKIVEDMEGETELERKVREELEEAGIKTRKTADPDTELMKLIAIDDEGNDMFSKEAIRRRKEVQGKLRAAVSYKQEKLQRLKKIKSKAYRRVLRKMKHNKEEKAMQRLEEIDPQAAVRKRREKMEKDRALERATLKHKNSATALRRKRDILKWNKQAREDMHEAEVIAERLTQKFSEKMDAAFEEESEESDDDEAEAKTDDVMTQEEVKQRSTASSIIQALRNDVAVNSPANISTGVASLPFMKRAYQKQKEELLAEIDQLEKDVNAAEKGAVDAATLQDELKSKTLGKTAVLEVSDSEESEHDEYGFLTQKAIQKREQQRKKEAKKQLNQLWENDAKERKEKEQQETAKQQRKKDEAKTKKEGKKAEKAEAAKCASGDTKSAAAAADPKPAEPNRKRKSSSADSASGIPDGGAEPPKKQQKKAPLSEKQKLRKGRDDGATTNGDAEEMREDVVEDDVVEDDVVDDDDDDDDEEEEEEDEEEEDEEDEETGKAIDLSDEDDEDVDLHGSAWLDDQEYLVQRAFESDNIDEEFMREKDDIIGKDAVPIDPQLALPGWGEWGGEDESLNKKQQARLEDLHKQRKEEIEELKKKRADRNLDNVIINENINTIPEKFQIRKLPHIFETQEEYQQSMRHPLAPDMNTALSSEQQLKAKVRTKKGRVIEPLTKDALPRKQVQKTRLKKTDTGNTPKGDK